MEKVTPPTRSAPQDQRPRDELDDLDRRLLALLRENSRATNQAVAATQTSLVFEHVQGSVEP